MITAGSTRVKSHPKIIYTISSTITIKYIIYVLIGYYNIKHLYHFIRYYKYHNIPPPFLYRLVGNLKRRRRWWWFTDGRHGHDHGHGYGTGLQIAARVSRGGLDGPVMGRTRVSVHPAAATEVVVAANRCS